MLHEEALPTSQEAELPHTAICVVVATVALVSASVGSVATGEKDPIAFAWKYYYLGLQKRTILGIRSALMGLIVNLNTTIGVPTATMSSAVDAVDGR
jgi:hypothetical protein